MRYIKDVGSSVLGITKMLLPEGTELSFTGEIKFSDVGLLGLAFLNMV